MTFFLFAIKLALIGVNAANVGHKRQAAFPLRSILAAGQQFGTDLGLGRGLIFYYMKSILGLSVITLALALVSLRPVYTLDKFNSLDDITSAIRLGNAGQLSRYLDSRV